MITHMKQITSDATDAYRSGDKIAMKEHRGARPKQSVHYLLNVGVLTDAPTWFLEHGGADSGSRTSKCPMCPRRVVAGTVRCECGYIVDPFLAYGKLYDENNDGGLMTARRMTKEQLTELHLYPRIKPLEEHLSDLNRAEKKNAKQQGQQKAQD
jgi:hypothetical protein